MPWIEQDEVGGGEEPLHEDAFEATAAAAAAAYMAYPEDAELALPAVAYGYPDPAPLLDPVLNP